MIQINDVVKTFDGFRALDGLTMRVEHLPAGFRLYPGPRPECV